MTNSVTKRLDRIERNLGIKDDKETNIHLILDMSGSMVSIGQTEVLGSANKYIKDVKAESPDAFIEVVVFDTTYESVIKKTRVSEVRKLTKDDYAPRGATALYDAMGKCASSARSGRNLFVVLTDGQENSSYEFNAKSLKDLIKKSERDGNKFIFLGANQDVILEAGKIGIMPKMTFGYVGTAAGYGSAMSVASSATMDWLGGQDVDLGNDTNDATVPA